MRPRVLGEDRKIAGTLELKQGAQVGYQGMERGLAAGGEAGDPGRGGSVSGWQPCH